MSVRLIAITKPVVDEMDSPQQLLAYCARVSSTANQCDHETGPKLIRSLIRRREWSPLEMASMVLEIETTRDISRQILRHRSFHFQEFSQRYATPEGLVSRECRLQHPTDRQASVECVDEYLTDWWDDKQRKVRSVAWSAYQAALAAGIAREQARAVLPEGLTPTRLYMAGTVRDWYHYCQLRTAHGTQAEHAEIARRCWQILIEQFPDLEDAA